MQELARALLSCSTSDGVMQAARDSIRSVIGGAQSVVVLLRHDDHPGGLVAGLADTPYADYINCQVPSNNEGLLGKALQERKTLLVRDTEMVDLLGPFAYERSLIVAPLFLSQDEEMGALYVGASNAGMLDDEHRELVETISYLTAMALRWTLLYETSQKMSITDPQTGLLSSGLLQTRLGEEVEYAARHNQSVILALLDIDNLGRYNHAMGHPAGDAVLQELGSIVKRTVAPDGVAYRSGGDEVALLLTGMSQEEAGNLCERIREAVQRHFAEHKFPLTISGGIATFPVHADWKGGLVKAAEEALHASKRSGRNRVSVAQAG